MKNIELRNKVVIINTAFMRIFNCIALQRYGEAVSAAKRLTEALEVWEKEFTEGQEKVCKRDKSKNIIKK
jgi:hypothetical protein